MHTVFAIEKTPAYLRAQLASMPAHEPICRQREWPFVTLSRESGTGGTSLAQALAKRLPAASGEPPWLVYSANLLEEMLRDNDLPPTLARFLPEDRVSEINASMGEILGLHPSLWDLKRKANELMRRMALSGHAILLGRGANFATADLRLGVHVRLIASAAHRAERTARWLSLDLSQAGLLNAQRDHARQRYVRATFGGNIGSPTEYDVTVNVERMSVDTVVGIIAQLVEHKRTQAAAATAAKPAAIDSAS